MTNRAAIGIDIGGTNIKAGLVSLDGIVLESRIIPTEASAGARSLIDKLYAVIGSLQDRARELGLDLAGVGVGTAGQVNARSRRVAGATGNLPEWADALSAEELERTTGLRAALDNDVNVMAIGEGWRGAGEAWNDFLCVTLGTGVGGCIIINKQPYRGRDGYAGEFGHMVVHHGGAPCSCGHSGCWEQYASVSALLRKLDASDDVLLQGVSTTEGLFEAARQGVLPALELVEWYADMVAVGLIGLVHSFNPPALIIGGGIAAQGDFLFDRIRSRVSSGLLQVYTVSEPTPIVQALLGNDAGVVGAARLILMNE